MAASTIRSNLPSRGFVLFSSAAPRQGASVKGEGPGARMSLTGEKSSTRDRILDIAQRLIQSRGYNAFSFDDLAEELDIRTASIHYHFPTKADLGIALLRRY